MSEANAKLRKACMYTVSSLKASKNSTMSAAVPM